MAQPYFSRAEVKSFIDQVSKVNDCVIYVGAGASIGRTGLPWATLIAQLLDDSAGTLSERVDLVKALQPLTASSAMAEQFASARGAGWRLALKETLRDQLYRGSGYRAEDPGAVPLAGSFNDRIINFATTLMRRKRVTIVTTNYDQFLLDSLFLQTQTSWRVLAAGLTEDGRAIRSMSAVSQILAADSDPSILSLIYMHGIVTRHTMPAGRPDASWYARSFPVISETDYATTRSSSETLLTSLFAQRDVIIVGASLTDPPLIAALAATVDAGRARYSIQPVADYQLPNTQPDKQPDGRALLLARAKQLGLQPLITDHYHQVSQVLDELRENLRVRTPPRAYSELSATHTYGQRLNGWWTEWLGSSRRSLTRRQRQAHHTLRSESIPLILDLLGVDVSRERLVLEIWLRLQPNTRRISRWASSETIFADETAIVSEVLEHGGKYVATQALLNGAPTYAAGRTASSRLQSFLAVPIYSNGKSDESTTTLPVGAVCLGSTAPQVSSSLNSRTRMKRAELLVALDGIGTLAADGSFYR